MDNTYRRNDPAVALLCILLVLPLFFLTYEFTVPAEDSVILYEYAKNLAHTGIISYGNSGVPIEGATDFLWMIAIAALKKIGVPEFFSALMLNFFGVAIIIASIKSNPARFLALLGLLVTPYLYSSLYGFSTLLFAAVYVLCIVNSSRGKRALYPLVLLLCLIRPDGVVWGAGIVLLRFMEARAQGALKGELRSFALYVFVPCVVYFVWRAWYFSELFPLPFLVKSTGARNLILFYGGSGLYVCSAFLPAVLASLLVGDRRSTLRRLAMLFVLPCLFYSAMRLEQNAGNRFLAPMFFGTMLILSREKKLVPMIALTVLSAVFSLKITAQTVQSLEQSKSETVYYISHDLAKMKGKMLVTEAGRLAYYSNWVTHDSWGLNTPRFAHSMIGYDDIDAGSYDLIVGHCDIGFLSDSQRPSGAVRSWENLCHTIAYYMKQKKYTILLVPILMSNAGSPKPALACQRYDIYALSPSYRDYDALRQLLKQRGAIDYSPKLNFTDDTVCV